MLDQKLHQHIQRMLSVKQYAIIAEECRASTSDGLMPLAQLHAVEAQRESRLLDLAPSTDGHVLVAISPTVGTFGIYQVPPQEPELDLVQGGTQPASPLQCAQSSAEIHAEHLHRLLECADSVHNNIRSGSIKHFEDLARSIPSSLNAPQVLEQLRKAHLPMIQLESKRGALQLGGKPALARKFLPCRQTYTVRAEIRAIDDDAKPNGTIHFKNVQSSVSDPSAPPVLNSRHRQSATLATGMESRTISILNYARFCHLQVELELRIDYDLVRGGYNIHVVRVLNEEVIMAETRSPRQIVQALF